MAALLPPVRWAQRKDRLFVTLELRDIKEDKVEWVSPSELKASFTSDGKAYAIDLVFYGELNIEESKYNKTGFHFQLNLVKKEAGPYWPRLIKEDKKYNHIALDWSKYVDEDEEDEEGNKGLSQDWDPSMMQGSTGFGGMGGMPGMGGMGGLGGMGGMGMPGMGGMGGDDDSDDDEEGHEGHDHGHDHDHDHGHDHHHHDKKLGDLDAEEEVGGNKQEEAKKE